MKQSKEKTAGSWKPGQSGNPNGRPPKGKTITGAVIEILEKESTEYPGRSYKEIFAEALVRSAISGNPAAMRLLMNYTDGMPVQKQILSTESEEPFEIIIKEEKA